MPQVPLPLKPAPDPKPHPTPAPAWLALCSAWLGLLVLLAAILLLFLPGTHDPRAELEHRAPYSIADRFLPIPVYGVAVALFTAIVVLWQMRKEPRPLPTAFANQRLQAKVGLVLALLAALVLYTHIALSGPRSAP